VITRELLSQQAAHLFAQRGYKGTSIDDLAKAVGIQKGSIYSHIGSKEELLAQICFAGAEAFHGCLDTVPETEPARERIRLALEAHLWVVWGQLDIATVWLNEWRYLGSNSLSQFLNERHRYEMRVQELFTTAIAEGALRNNVDVGRATLMFLSVGNWAYTWLKPESDVKQCADTFAELMLEGMARPTSCSD
jgi:TetR/AcrR family transcriptional regulator, cholesterol catabolism regulator